MQQKNLNKIIDELILKYFYSRGRRSLKSKEAISQIADFVTNVVLRQNCVLLEHPRYLITTYRLYNRVICSERIWLPLFGARPRDFNEFQCQLSAAVLWKCLITSETPHLRDVSEILTDLNPAFIRQALIYLGSLWHRMSFLGSYIPRITLFHLLCLHAGIKPQQYLERWDKLSRDVYMWLKALHELLAGTLCIGFMPFATHVLAYFIQGIPIASEEFARAAVPGKAESFELSATLIGYLAWSILTSIRPETEVPFKEFVEPFIKTVRTYLHSLKEVIKILQERQTCLINELQVHVLTRFEDLLKDFPYPINSSAAEGFVRADVLRYVLLYLWCNNVRIDFERLLAEGLIRLM